MCTKYACNILSIHMNISVYIKNITRLLQNTLFYHLHFFLHLRLLSYILDFYLISYIFYTFLINHITTVMKQVKVSSCLIRWQKMTSNWDKCQLKWACYHVRLCSHNRIKIDTFHHCLSLFVLLIVGTDNPIHHILMYRIQKEIWH